MTARILRTELRRSVAVILGMVTIVILLVLLHMGNSPALKDISGWTHQWDSMARWERYWLVAVCGIVLGLGALQGRADHRARMDELLATTPRPAWRRAGPKIAAAAIALSAAYLLVLGACAIQVAGNATYDDLAWLPIAIVGLLAVLAAAVLGLGIGRLLPSLLTAPIVAVVGVFGLALLDASTTESTSFNETIALLAPELREPTDAFTTVAPSVHLGQAAWFLGLAITGYALFVVRGWRARLGAFLPAVLGLVVALVVLPGTEAAAYPTNSVASAQVCADGTPKVCVTRVNASELPYLVGPARQALAVLSTLPNAPTEVIESDPAPQQDPVQNLDVPLPAVRQANVLVVDFNDWALGDYTTANALLHDPNRLLSGLLAGAGTQVCPGSNWAQESRQDSARSVATAWATGTLPKSGVRLGPDPVAEQAWQQFRALPGPVQRQRITAFRAASMTCHGDLLSILTTGSAS